MENSAQICPYAVKISGLKKQYRLGQIGGGTLQADLASWWAKIRGKEDPNTRIDSVPRIAGDTFWALNGIDLTITQGEAVGIIGRNGAGKSTLLKLLSRITAPTDGEIDIYGRISSMLEVGTGFNGEMTGRENVYLNGAILGMSKAEIDAKMENIIDFSEVREFIDTPVKRYSSGMYVKLAFSVAAHLDSEIMIMDEVLAVGDMAFQKKCLNKMKEAVTAENRTVLYVSHNMETIRQLCDRCIVLDEGKIIFDGNVEEGIACYMGGADALKAHREYTPKDYFRKHNVLFRILSTDLDRNDCQYCIGEPVRLRIRCIAQKNIPHAGLRFQLISKDGVRVGTSFCDTVFSPAAEQEYLLSAEIPTDMLAPGQYLCEIAVFTDGANETYNYINTLENGPCFEIKQSLSAQSKTCWRKNWGHVRLQNAKLEVTSDEP